MKLNEQIDSLYDSMVEIRRHMHMHPELSFQEEQTKQYIYDQIKDYDVDIERDVGGNGLVARLIVDERFPTVGLRADFDALPIHDKKEVPYRSQVDGVMHACGHDGHTSMLVTALKILSGMRKSLRVNVVFLFQHAEEVLPGGAKSMVAAGAIEGVDTVFGLHMASHIDTGKIGYVRGYTQANADGFSIRVKGSGGHGAAPHKNKDSVVASAHLIQQLQTIVSRDVDPLKSAVVSVGQFKGGFAFNVIPSVVEVKGTVRTFEPDVRALVKHRIGEICRGIEASFGMECEFEYFEGYPSMKNDVRVLDFALSLTENADFIRGLVEKPPKMGGEDFAYFAQQAPGSFLMLGSGNAEKKTNFPHHNEHFDIDEESLKAGVEILVKFASNFDLSLLK